MVKKLLAIFLLFGLVLSTAIILSCSDDDSDEKINNQSMTDLEIDPEFDFTFFKDVNVSLMAMYKGTFYIYDTSDNLLAKGLIDLPDGYQGTIQVPNNLSVVKLRYSEIEDIEVYYDIFNETIDYFFFDSGNVRGDRSVSKVVPIFNCLEDLGGGYYNIYFSYYSPFEDMVTIPRGNNNRFIFCFGEDDDDRDDDDDDCEIEEDVGQPFEFYPGYHIDAFVLENQEFDCEEDDDDRDDDDECYIKWDLDGLYGQSYSVSYAINDDDYICPRGIDFDEDGIPDEDDDFPEDPDLAYINYYPGSTSESWATLAFEDRWPLMGDYDFNDLVVNYRFVTYDDPNDNILEGYGYFSLRASGASYQNGFALELPFAPDNLTTLELTPNTSTGYEVIDGSSSTIIKFFSDALEVMQKPEESLFVNTDPEDVYLNPVDFELHFLLDNAVNESSLPFNLPYNPFVTLNNIPDKEVHLSDMPPTFNADNSFLGTNDDDSDPGTGRYYKTELNLPWAINVLGRWAYPIERISIIQAYNYFDEWAESSGVDYPYWYENTEDNVQESQIYPNP